ncbi:MAG: S8 family serine peptidase [Candidatus Thorarchaeota archaeon]
MKKVSAALIAFCILESVFAGANLVSHSQIERSHSMSTPREMSFEHLSAQFGSEIPVVVTFEEISQKVVSDLVESLGLQFSLGTAKSSNMGNFYLIEGSAMELQMLSASPYVQDISVRGSSEKLRVARDISIPEIGADRIWATLDGLGRNITGEGIVIADLDTGVDWRHPDLWFADGLSFSWFDNNTNLVVDNGTDSVDLDSSGFGTVDERLRIIDIDRDGTFNATTDWLWAENVSQDGIIQPGEPFFVVNDTNHNDALDLSEKLIMLRTPKTKYIVERSGGPSPTIQVWERGTNLTASTHEDSFGHGTSVSGILLGGQIGFRKYVGVAPMAELIMMKIFGTQNTTLDIYEALQMSYNLGAQVIIIEVGQWVEVFLDGSSVVEQYIDTLDSLGVPVIVPSGNLGGQSRHAMFDAIAPSYPQHLIDFMVPNVDFQEIELVWITVLSRNETDFMRGNFTITVPTVGSVLLHPKYGYRNYGQDVLAGIVFNSYVLNSSRGTKMMYIEMWASGGLPASPPLPPYQLNVTLNSNATVHCYIADASTAWQGGAVWATAADVKNEYLITHPSTADSAISVASYHTRSFFGTPGSIAAYSGIGPRIDGAPKQGVAAPGGWDVVSTYSNESAWASWNNASGQLPLNPSFGGYALFSGTSAAGPHVAGCAALMMQVNASRATEFADIIKNAANSDADTGLTPNAIWGGGKLNVSAAVQQVMPGPDTTPPAIGVPITVPAIPNNETPITINVVVSDFSGVDTVILEFYNGTHWNNVTMADMGTYFSGSIPVLPEGVTVIFRIHANDTIGNSAVSPDYTFTVQSVTTTTTPTGTTTSTPTGTTSPTSTTSPTTPTTPTEPDYLMLSLMLGIVLALIVVACLISRRRRR